MTWFEELKTIFKFHVLAYRWGQYQAYKDIYQYSKRRMKEHER